MNGLRIIALTLGLMAGIAVLPLFSNSGYRVESSGITVNLSPDGEVTGVVLGQGRTLWQVLGKTGLAGCRVEGPISREQTKEGRIQFKKKLACDVNGIQRKVGLVENLSPTKDSVRWEMELDGEGPSWSTAIETRLHFPNAERSRFWTAWGSPKPDDAFVRNSSWKVLRQKANDWLYGFDGWEDPLTTTPFVDRRFWYGAPYYQYDEPRINYVPIYRDLFCLPLATVMEKKDDLGVSVVLSPADILQDMTMTTSRTGDVVFARLFRRIEEGKPVRFSMDLVAHEADWRGGVRWMSTRYPDYFNPPLLQADDLGGTAAYSSFEGDLDIEKFKRMAFKANWKVDFEHPYQGMFLPPVPDDREWARPYQSPSEDTSEFQLSPTVSIRKMADYSRRMRAMGFYVLNYFNVAEFGRDIVYPFIPNRAATAALPDSDPNLWSDSNDYLYVRLRDSLLFHAEKEKPGFGKMSLASGDPGPIRDGNRDVILDCGQASYQNYLLEQARRLIEKIPDSAGIAVDEGQYFRLYNFQADDGVSWYDGPVRYLGVSWKEALEKLGPLEHAAGQVIFVNDHLKRIDIMRQADGLFDESNSLGSSKNTTALLGIFKPTIGWVIGEGNFQPDPDTFLQRYLYLGTFPVAPFPENDHALHPSALADKLYSDYGPLFESMRGRKWVLLPHVLNVTRDAAKANLFKVPAGYVAPVMMGGAATEAEVTVNDLPELFSSSAAIICEVIHPGEDRWGVCKFDRDRQRMTVRVPLVRSCAMLRFRVGRL